jgi:hypothetical protein
MKNGAFNNVRRRLVVCLAIAVLAFSAGLLAQEPVSDLEDLIDARGNAIDGLSERGYTHVRTEKSDDSSYTYWTENRTQRCVIARVAQGRVASIVYAPSSDCGAAGGEATVLGEFDTVCGVIQDGKTHRYRCEVEDKRNPEGRKVTVLRFPDNSLKLHWRGETQVGVIFAGMKPIRTTYSTHEGETSFKVEGKTYFYISDKRAAEMELEHFEE